MEYLVLVGLIVFLSNPLWLPIVRYAIRLYIAKKELDEIERYMWSDDDS